MEDLPMLQAGPSDFDRRYEFDAPRYHDFQAGSPPGEIPDTWFHTSATKALATPVGSKPGSKDTTSVKNDASENASQGAATKSTAGATKSGTKAGPEEAEQVRAVLAHITNAARSAGTATAGKAAAAKATPKSGAATVTKASPGPVTRSQLQQAAAAEQPAPGPKPGAAAAAAAPRPAPAAPAAGPPAEEAGAGRAAPARPATRSAAAAKPSRAPAPVRAPPTKVRAPAAGRAKKPHITVPKSPFLRSKARSAAHRSAPVKATEELEMEQIEAEKRAAAALRRRNTRTAASSRAAPAPRAPAPRAPKRAPASAPREPNLRTAKRQRVHAMETRGAADPQQPSPWKSAAQRMAEFTAGVAPKPAPRRRGAGGAAAAHSKLTVPRTPRFATKTRARASRFKPTEEEEAERAAAEAAALKEDLRRKAAEAAHPAPQPMRRSTRRALTETKPFSFATDVRAAQRAQRPEAELPPPPFVFGGAGGPFTRNRVKMATTAAPQTQQAAPEAPASGSSTGSGQGLSLRARRTTAGPMMLGGARRVLRTEQQEGEGAAPPGYDAAAEPDGMQAIIRAGADAAERTTLHNPLFNAYH